MKTIMSFVSVLLFASVASGKERMYTGSTPANAAVRTFIGIPLSDSIDFIRWKVILFENRYELDCNYGISKPNTNGFINGGSRVALNGDFQRENNIYLFKRGAKTLKTVALNANLLHLLNTDNSLMVGNDGWSYTLNNTRPAATTHLSMIAPPGALKDSMAFSGRTPCQGIVGQSSSCYKLKWSLVFYAKANKPAGYTIRSPWRSGGGKTGTWKIVKGQNGQTIYQLNDNGNGFLYFTKLGEHILAISDEEGKLLVGNGDFSYTLNRRW